MKEYDKLGCEMVLSSWLVSLVLGLRDVYCHVTCLEDRAVRRALREKREACPGH